MWHFATINIEPTHAHPPGRPKIHSPRPYLKGKIGGLHCCILYRSNVQLTIHNKLIGSEAPVLLTVPQDRATLEYCQKVGGNRFQSDPTPSLYIRFPFDGRSPHLIQTLHGRGARIFLRAKKQSPGVFPRPSYKSPVNRFYYINVSSSLVNQ